MHDLNLAEIKAQAVRVDALTDRIARLRAADHEQALIAVSGDEAYDLLVALLANLHDHEEIVRVFEQWLLPNE